MYTRRQAENPIACAATRPPSDPAEETPGSGAREQAVPFVPRTRARHAPAPPAHLPCPTRRRAAPDLLCGPGARGSTRTREHAALGCLPARGTASAGAAARSPAWDHRVPERRGTRYSTTHAAHARAVDAEHAERIAERRTPPGHPEPRILSGQGHHPARRIRGMSLPAHMPGARGRVPRTVPQLLLRFPRSLSADTLCPPRPPPTPTPPR